MVITYDQLLTRLEKASEVLEQYGQQFRKNLARRTLPTPDKRRNRRSEQILQISVYPDYSGLIGDRPELLVQEK
jgi:hypothetical protein